MDQFKLRVRREFAQDLNRSSPIGMFQVSPGLSLLHHKILQSLEQFLGRVRSYRSPGHLSRLGVLVPGKFFGRSLLEFLDALLQVSQDFFIEAPMYWNFRDRLKTKVICGTFLLQRAYGFLVRQQTLYRVRYLSRLLGFEPLCQKRALSVASDSCQKTHGVKAFVAASSLSETSQPRLHNRKLRRNHLLGVLAHLLGPGNRECSDILREGLNGNL